LRKIERDTKKFYYKRLENANKKQENIYFNYINNLYPNINKEFLNLRKDAPKNNPIEEYSSKHLNQAIKDMEREAIDSQVKLILDSKI